MEEIKKGRVLVDFYATWCGPCKMLAKQLEQYEKEVEDVKVVKVNVDDNHEMSAAFGVRSIPTLVYMEDGEVIDRSAGAKNLEQLKEFTKIA
jgi:thioredoxin 1